MIIEIKVGFNQPAASFGPDPVDTAFDAVGDRRCLWRRELIEGRQCSTGNRAELWRKPKTR